MNRPVPSRTKLEVNRKRNTGAARCDKACLRRQSFTAFGYGLLVRSARRQQLGAFRLTLLTSKEGNSRGSGHKL